jgi:dephospho-CoA kinase
VLNTVVTGNIGAGKSTVVSWFRDWGATIIDADELVRAAQTPGSAVLAAIVRRFGADVLAPDGALDRAALRSKVMGDDPALRALNAIVHPAVQERRAALLAQAAARGDALVVNDIPLLFEALSPEGFDVVILVESSSPLRHARLRLTRGLTEDDATRLIAAQMPSERKRDRSHFVIPNEGSLAELEAKARAVFLELRRRAAAGPPVDATLLLATADARDEPSDFAPVAARYGDAGVRVIQARGRALPARIAAERPGAILASARALRGARDAWQRAGRPGALVFVTPDPDPVAVRLDLRPWGGERLVLGEEGATGEQPRADLFPTPNPLA